MKGIVEASLLRKLLVRVLVGGLLFLAALQLLEGYERFTAYQNTVASCIDSQFKEQNDALAKNLKAGNLDTLAARLNGIEFTCAFAAGPLAKNEVGHTHLQQVNFYWHVEKDDVQVLRIGKNLLRGPVNKISQPLSIWKEGNQGDYWVGAIHLELFYGDHLSQLVSEQWIGFTKEVLKLFVIWLAAYVLFYKHYFKPNAAFVRAISKSKVMPAELRNLVASRNDELSAVWRSFLSHRENAEVERFEFESQIKDLESHITKIERGQVGQSLVTEHASLDIKNALSRAIVTQAKAAAFCDLDAIYKRDYLAAIMSVASNLHDRAQMESGELILSEIRFNFVVMTLQVYHEFKPRMERRDILGNIQFDPGIPVFTVGDPEKIKRIIRNAFKRALLQPSVESMTLKARYQPDTRTGPRHVLELVTIGKPGASSERHSYDDGRKAPEKGPTPMLEMLCYIMGARWVFSMGLDGELKQSLSLSLPGFDAPDTSSLDISDNNAIKQMSILVYDLPDQANSVIAKTLKAAGVTIQYASGVEKLHEFTHKNKIMPDLVIISDMVESMSSKEFVADLRRKLGGHSQIVVVSESPQIGDGQNYIDLGIQGYLSREQFAEIGLLLINYIAQYRMQVGELPSLVTRYTLLDYYGVNQDLSLPGDLSGAVARGVVLLVAEELVCIEYTRNNCARMGVRLVHYSSAFEAIDAFRAEAFDVVLIDDQFQDVDALTIIKMMRQIESRRNSSKPAPIIALGSNDFQDKEAYTRVGATEVINKYTIDGSLGIVMNRYITRH